MPAFQGSDDLAEFFKWFYGEELPGLQPERFYTLAQDLYQVADHLDAAGAEFLDGVRTIRSGVMGAAEEAFVSSSEDVAGSLEKAPEYVQTLARMMTEFSAVFNYVVITVMAITALLLFELLVALKLLWINPAVLLEWLAKAPAVRQAIFQLFVRLAGRASLGAAFNILYELLVDLFAQLTNRGKKYQRGWNDKNTRDAVASGALESLVGGVFALGGAGARRLGRNTTVGGKSVSSRLPGGRGGKALGAGAGLTGNAGEEVTTEVVVGLIMNGQIDTNILGPTAVSSALNGMTFGAIGAGRDAIAGSGPRRDGAAHTSSTGTGTPGTGNPDTVADTDPVPTYEPPPPAYELPPPAYAEVDPGPSTGSGTGTAAGTGGAGTGAAGATGAGVGAAGTGAAGTGGTGTAGTGGTGTGLHGVGTSRGSTDTPATSGSVPPVAETPETQTGTQVSPQSGMPPGAQAGAQADTQVSPQPGMPPGAQVGTQVSAQSGAQVGGPQPGMPPGSQLGGQVGAQASPQPGAQAGGQVGPQSGVPAGTQAGTQFSAQSGAQVGAQPGMPPGAQSGGQAGAQVGAQSGAQPSPQPGPQAGAQSGTQAGGWSVPGPGRIPELGFAGGADAVRVPGAMESSSSSSVASVPASVDVPRRSGGLLDASVVAGSSAGTSSGRVRGVLARVRGERGGVSGERGADATAVVARQLGGDWRSGGVGYLERLRPGSVTAVWTRKGPPADVVLVERLDDGRFVQVETVQGKKPVRTEFDLAGWRGPGKAPAVFSTKFVVFTDTNELGQLPLGVVGVSPVVMPAGTARARSGRVAAAPVTNPSALIAPVANPPGAVSGVAGHARVIPGVSDRGVAGRSVPVTGSGAPVGGSAARSQPGRGPRQAGSRWFGWRRADAQARSGFGPLPYGRGPHPMDLRAASGERVGRSAGDAMFAAKIAKNPSDHEVRATYPWLAGVNPRNVWWKPGRDVGEVFRTNCVITAIATDMSLRAGVGHKASGTEALPVEHLINYQRRQLKLPDDADGVRYRVKDLSSVREAMKEAGTPAQRAAEPSRRPRPRGLVVVRTPSDETAHVFNVVRRFDGTVYFLDGQTGRAARLPAGEHTIDFLPLTSDIPQPKGSERVLDKQHRQRLVRDLQKATGSHVQPRVDSQHARTRNPFVGLPTAKPARDVVAAVDSLDASAESSAWWAQLSNVRERLALFRDAVNSAAGPTPRSDTAVSDLIARVDDALAAATGEQGSFRHVTVEDHSDLRVGSSGPGSGPASGSGSGPSSSEMTISLDEMDVDVVDSDDEDMDWSSASVVRVEFRPDDPVALSRADREALDEPIRRVAEYIWHHGEGMVPNLDYYRHPSSMDRRNPEASVTDRRGATLAAVDQWITHQVIRQLEDLAEQGEQRDEAAVSALASGLAAMIVRHRLTHPGVPVGSVWVDFSEVSSWPDTVDERAAPVWWSGWETSAGSTEPGAAGQVHGDGSGAQSTVGEIVNADRPLRRVGTRVWVVPPRFETDVQRAFVARAGVPDNVVLVGAVVDERGDLSVPAGVEMNDEDLLDQLTSEGVFARAITGEGVDGAGSPILVVRLRGDEDGIEEFSAGLFAEIQERRYRGEPRPGGLVIGSYEDGDLVWQAYRLDGLADPFASSGDAVAEAMLPPFDLAPLVHQRLAGTQVDLDDLTLADLVLAQLPWNSFSEPDAPPRYDHLDAGVVDSMDVVPVPVWPGVSSDSPSLVLVEARGWLQGNRVLPVVPAGEDTVPVRLGSGLVAPIYRLPATGDYPSRNVFVVHGTGKHARYHGRLVDVPLWVNRFDDGYVAVQVRREVYESLETFFLPDEHFQIVVEPGELSADGTRVRNTAPRPQGDEKWLTADEYHRRLVPDRIGRYPRVILGQRPFASAEKGQSAAFVSELRQRGVRVIWAYEQGEDGTEELTEGWATVSSGKLSTGTKLIKLLGLGSRAGVFGSEGAMRRHLLTVLRPDPGAESAFARHLFVTGSLPTRSVTAQLPIDVNSAEEWIRVQSGIAVLPHPSIFYQDADRQYVDRFNGVRVKVPARYVRLASGESIPVLLLDAASLARDWVSIEPAPVGASGYVVNVRGPGSLANDIQEAVSSDILLSIDRELSTRPAEEAPTGERDIQRLARLAYALRVQGSLWAGPRYVLLVAFQALSVGSFAVVGVVQRNGVNRFFPIVREMDGRVYLVNQDAPAASPARVVDITDAVDDAQAPPEFLRGTLQAFVDNELRLRQADMSVPGPPRVVPGGNVEERLDREEFLFDVERALRPPAGVFVSADRQNHLDHLDAAIAWWRGRPPRDRLDGLYRAVRGVEDRPGPFGERPTLLDADAISAVLVGVHTAAGAPDGLTLAGRGAARVLTAVETLEDLLYDLEQMAPTLSAEAVQYMSRAQRFARGLLSQLRPVLQRRGMIETSDETRPPRQSPGPGPQAVSAPDQVPHAEFVRQVNRHLRTFGRAPLSPHEIAPYLEAVRVRAPRTERALAYWTASHIAGRPVRLPGGSRSPAGEGSFPQSTDSERMRWAQQRSQLHPLPHPLPDMSRQGQAAEPGADAATGRMVDAVVIDADFVNDVNTHLRRLEHPPVDMETVTAAVGELRSGYRTSEHRRALSDLTATYIISGGEVPRMRGGSSSDAGGSDSGSDSGSGSRGSSPSASSSDSESDAQSSQFFAAEGDSHTGPPVWWPAWGPMGGATDLGSGRMDDVGAGVEPGDFLRRVGTRIWVVPREFESERQRAFLAPAGVPEDVVLVGAVVDGYYEPPALSVADEVDTPPTAWDFLDKLVAAGDFETAAAGEGAAVTNGRVLVLVLRNVDPREGNLFAVDLYREVMGRRTRGRPGPSGLVVGQYWNGELRWRAYLDDGRLVDCNSVDAAVMLIQITPRNVSTLIHRHLAGERVETIVRQELADRLLAEVEWDNPDPVPTYVQVDAGLVSPASLDVVHVPVPTTLSPVAVLSDVRGWLRGRDVLPVVPTGAGTQPVRIGAGLAAPVFRLPAEGDYASRSVFVLHHTGDEARIGDQLRPVPVWVNRFGDELVAVRLQPDVSEGVNGFLSYAVQNRLTIEPGRFDASGERVRNSAPRGQGDAAWLTVDEYHRRLAWSPGQPQPIVVFAEPFASREAEEATPDFITRLGDRGVQVISGHWRRNDSGVRVGINWSLRGQGWQYRSGDLTDLLNYVVGEGRFDAVPTMTRLLGGRGDLRDLAYARYVLHRSELPQGAPAPRWVTLDTGVPVDRVESWIRASSGVAVVAKSDDLVGAYAHTSNIVVPARYVRTFGFTYVVDTAALAADLTSITGMPLAGSDWDTVHTRGGELPPYEVTTPGIPIDPQRRLLGAVSDVLGAPEAMRSLMAPGRFQVSEALDALGVPQREIHVGDLRPVSFRDLRLLAPGAVAEVRLDTPSGSSRTALLVREDDGRVYLFHVGAVPGRSDRFTDMTDLVYSDSDAPDGPGRLQLRFDGEGRLRQFELPAPGQPRVVGDFSGEGFVWDDFVNELRAHLRYRAGGNANGEAARRLQRFEEMLAWRADRRAWDGLDELFAALRGVELRRPQRWSQPGSAMADGWPPLLGPGAIVDVMLGVHQIGISGPDQVLSGHGWDRVDMATRALESLLQGLRSVYTPLSDGDVVGWPSPELTEYIGRVRRNAQLLLSQLRPVLERRRMLGEHSLNGDAPADEGLDDRMLVDDEPGGMSSTDVTMNDAAVPANRGGRAGAAPSRQGSGRTARERVSRFAPYVGHGEHRPHRSAVNSDQAGPSSASPSAPAVNAPPMTEDQAGRWALAILRPYRTPANVGNQVLGGLWSNAVAMLTHGADPRAVAQWVAAQARARGLSPQEPTTPGR
ncbi:hypothetical protein [Micromonospora violae]|uniref:hypothetical protein n=1 Tax=Micromonospora violae TaxID=1278207 RepID=UPI0033E279FC